MLAVGKGGRAEEAAGATSAKFSDRRPTTPPSGGDGNALAARCDADRGPVEAWLPEKFPGGRSGKVELVDAETGQPTIFLG